MQELDLAAMTGLLVAIQQFLARTPSAVMITNLSDMLAETAQINVPGTVSEHPNWRHRCCLSVSALAADPLVRHIALAVATEARQECQAATISSKNGFGPSLLRAAPSGPPGRLRFRDTMRVDGDPTAIS
jgi:4-alpha-glucanotransferase